MRSETITLYYIHDPMCSWCWAFRPVWERLKQQLPPSVHVKYLLGGLAPDSDTAMAALMQQEIQRHWRVIQKRMPGTMFNFEFWTQCQPRRSTYPACRAVIAARQQGPQYEDAMIRAIQTAYYLEARNPSDNETLIDLAKQLNLGVDQFSKALNDATTQTQLLQNIRESQQIGAYGFPSLVLHTRGENHAIGIDYNHMEIMLMEIESFF